MLKNITLILALAIEFVLLIIILLVLLLGALGVFLPILPGVFLIGFAVALYSLMIKSDYSKITPKVNRRLLKIRERINNLKITKNFMGVIKKVKQRNREKAKEQILKNGLVLFGFNIALFLAFLFGFIGFSILGSLFEVEGIFIAFIPLLVVFLFAASSAIVWYRFGQILGDRFKKRRVLNSSIVVLISILPLLVILIFFAGVLSLAGGAQNQLLVITFLGLVLLTILASVFELLVVNLGVITKQ